jgi:hypothetical protein
MAAVAVLLFGCTSGDDEGSADGTEAGPDSSVDPAEAARAPGVTDDTIKVGVTYVDYEAIAEVADVPHGDNEAAYQALFDDINANGGINGRMVEPVFASVNPIGTAPAEEACLRLTEDEAVFAVIGFVYADASLCYLEAHDTAMIGGSMTPERLERATAPWFTPEAGSDMEIDVIRSFAESGLLDDDVAVFANITDEALLNETVVPLLDELGIEPVDTAVLDAPENDVAAQDAATAVIAERFKSAGAQTVMVIGGGGVTWAGGIESTDYRPATLFSSRASIDAYVADAAGRDPSVLEGAILGGLYTAPPDDDSRDPGMQDCVDIQVAAGLEDIDAADAPEGQTNVVEPAVCAYVALFTAIAEAAGEDLNYGTFRQAGNDLGELEIPGYPDPFTFGPPPAADGDPPVYLFEWDASEEAFLVQADQRVG